MAGEREHIERAVQSYVAAWHERDHERRALLLAAAVSEDVHIAIAGREIAGRAALEMEIATFHKSYPKARGRLSTPIDIQVRVCRFAAVVEQPDGSSVAEMFDACTCDTSGRIKTIITFSGSSIAGTAPPAK